MASPLTAPSIRREDWPSGLAEVLERARHEAFAWGQHDCCLFAADVADALCGTQIAARFRGRYKTARGARGLLRRLGGLDGLMTLAGPEIPVTLAQRGDLVALPAEDGPQSAGVMLAVAVGDVAAGAGVDGLAFFPIARAERAWAVGRPA